MAEVLALCSAVRFAVEWSCGVINAVEEGVARGEGGGGEVCHWGNRGFVPDGTRRREGGCLKEVGSVAPPFAEGNSINISTGASDD